jgi:cytochrome c-type protein NapC
MPVEEFVATIEIAKPFPNSTCIRCHSTFTPAFAKVGDHVSAMPALRDGTISCAGEGCHGPAHPFSKEARKQRHTSVGVLP